MQGEGVQIQPVNQFWELGDQKWTNKSKMFSPYSYLTSMHTIWPILQRLVIVHSATERDQNSHLLNSIVHLIKTLQIGDYGATINDIQKHVKRKIK